VNASEQLLRSIDAYSARARGRHLNADPAADERFEYEYRTRTERLKRTMHPELLRDRLKLPQAIGIVATEHTLRGGVMRHTFDGWPSLWNENNAQLASTTLYRPFKGLDGIRGVVSATWQVLSTPEVGVNEVVTYSDVTAHKEVDGVRTAVDCANSLDLTMQANMMPHPASLEETIAIASLLDTVNLLNMKQPPERQ